MTSQDARPEPPLHVVELAVEVSGWSPCRSKRGVVVFDPETGNVICHGHNSKPECDGSEACKAACRIDAVHAEQCALLSSGGRSARGADMLHVKTVDGQLVASGGPSCVQCSKLARYAGIAGFWLYHESGWRRYEMADFHRLSLRASASSEAGIAARSWETAALLKDRTRRAIRDRHRAGESIPSLADDYGVPEPFVSALVAWQMFSDEPESVGIAARVRELETALNELYRLVNGECPSLLNDDSGGDARLDLKISALLRGEER
jgi:hypothetical protein